MEDIHYIKRIDTGNKSNEYIDEQTIDFILPRNKVDLSSFKIFYDVKIDPLSELAGGFFRKRFMPRLSSSIIDTLTITKDGEEIQTIKDYNVIFNIRNDAMSEEDQIDGDKTDTLNYAYTDNENINKRVCDYVSQTVDPLQRAPIKYRYFINSFLGLINEGTSSILDCTKNEYKISIKLAPKYITYRGIENFVAGELPATINTFPENYHYRLSNVFANINVHPQSTPTQSKIMFKHYHVVKGANDATKNVNISHKHKGNLDYLMASFVVLGEYDRTLELFKCSQNQNITGAFFRRTYAALADYLAIPITTAFVSSKTMKSLSTEFNLDNSLYFKRQGTNLKSSQFLINGQAVTPQMSMSEIYSQAKEFFNHQMTRPKSLSSFENEFFVFPLNVSNQQEDFSMDIQWSCTADRRTTYNAAFINSGKAYPILILCSNKEIEV